MALSTESSSPSFIAAAFRRRLFYLCAPSATISAGRLPRYS
jgi:hypothetical protein